MSSPADTVASADDQDKEKDKDKVKADDDTVEAQLDLLNPDALQLDQSVDEPVTSGGDGLDNLSSPTE
jgi:hypothetical protein